MTLWLRRFNGSAIARITTPAARAARAALAAGGAFYEPSDLTSLYQDRTGGATGASGQPIGIMLDKSYMGGQTAASYISAQNELATNGGFDADTGWTKGTSWTISGGAARAGGTGSSLTQAITFPGASFAVVTYTVVSIASGNISAQLQGGSTSTGATRTSAGTYTEVLSVNTNTTLAFVSGGTTPDAVIDAVSIKYIPGFHAVAASDAARPVLTVTGTLIYVAPDGADDWMVVTPTLNLGETWWHIGGWRSPSAGRRAFALSATGATAALNGSATPAWSWCNAANTAYTDATTSTPNANHVLTIEDGTNIAMRYNAVQQVSPFAPFDDSAAVQGLALFTGNNSTWASGMNGRFYGGVFAPGALDPTDRAVIESYLATLTQVTL